MIQAVPNRYFYKWEHVDHSLVRAICTVIHSTESILVAYSAYLRSVSWYRAIYLSCALSSFVHLFNLSTCFLLRSECYFLFDLYLLLSALSLQSFLFTFASLQKYLSLSIFLSVVSLIMYPSIHILNSFSVMTSASPRKNAAWKLIPTSYSMQRTLVDQRSWAQQQYQARAWPVPTSFNIVCMALILTMGLALSSLSAKQW